VIHCSLARGSSSDPGGSRRNAWNCLVEPDETGNLISLLPSVLALRAAVTDRALVAAEADGVGDAVTEATERT